MGDFFSGKQVAALRGALKKVKSASDKAFAFYYLTDGSKNVMLYIDSAPNKKPDRFKTPKLIDEHLKKTGLNGSGVTVKPIKQCRSCAGTVQWKSDKPHFVITTKAGKAGYSDLKKGLAKDAIRKLVGDSTYGKLPTDDVETRSRRDNAREIMKGFEPILPRSQTGPITKDEAAKLYANSGNKIEVLGENIVRLREYLEQYRDQLSPDRIASIEQSLTQMEAFYDTVENWENDTGALQSSYDELVEDASEEEGVMAELAEQFDKISEMSGQLEDTTDKIKEIVLLIDQMNRGELPEDFVAEQLEKLKSKIPDDSRLGKAVAAFEKTRELASQAGITFEIDQDIVQNVQDLSQEGIAFVKDKLGQSDTHFFGNQDLENEVGPHLDVLKEMFNGGKEAAAFAGTLAKLANAHGPDPRKWDKNIQAEATAELQATLDLYASYSKEGTSFAQGITYLGELGCLVEGSVKLNANAEATLGPLYAKVSGMLEVYAGCGGVAKGELTIGLLKGIKAWAEIEVDATVSASAEAQLRIGIEDVGDFELGGYASAVAQANAHAKGAFVISPEDGTIQLSGSIGGTVGVRAEAGGSFALQAKGAEIFRVAGKVEAVAGVGGKIGGSFSLEGGKLTIQLDLGAVVGIGGGLTADVTVDFPKLAAFIFQATQKTFTATIREILKQFQKYKPLVNSDNEDLDFYDFLIQNDTADSAGFKGVLKEFKSDIGGDYGDVTPADMRAIARGIVGIQKTLTDDWIQQYQKTARDQLARLANKKLWAEIKKLDDTDGGKTTLKIRLKNAEDIQAQNFLLDACKALSIDMMTHVTTIEYTYTNSRIDIGNVEFNFSI